MQVTINKALILQKQLRERINDLKSLRQQVSVRRTSYYSSQGSEQVEPQYDIREVDKQVLTLQKIEFDLEAGIKEANNTYTFEVNFSTDDLFKSLS